MRSFLRIIGFFALSLVCLNLQAQKRYKKKHILKDLQELPGFSQAYVGFMLFDPETEKVIACQYDNKYMTPASNTKLYTFYAGHKLLGKAVPAMQYVIQGDSLIFWGTGNPLLLHPKLTDRAALDFLQSRKEQLFYWPRPMADSRFGPGWGWDDFNGYYSAEKSVFPIYGNSVEVLLDREHQSISLTPDYFESQFSAKTWEKYRNRSLVQRAETLNQYEYQIGEDPGDEVEDRIDTLIKPFQYSPELFLELLSDTLNRSVQFVAEKPANAAVQTLKSLPTDTLFKHMLQPSDNLMAEQILLMASGTMSDTLSTRATIKWMKENHFKGWQDEPLWVDGSGLSRYNMFTPRGTVKLLHELQKEVGETRLFELLPAGGESGTIKRFYAGENGPYVFAKTGTLSNNHCLSGYLKTDSGKTLIFTFMVNHYAHSTNMVKQSMEHMLKKIRKAY